MTETHTSNTAPLIDMRGVTVGSSLDLQTVVLEQVDWAVNRGEYWVLAGMQGAGKTELLNMTAGLMPPQKGFYQLFGHDMPMKKSELLPDRLRIGLVFDGGKLFHNLTIRENITLPLQYHRNLGWQELQRRVDAMLDLTALRPHANSTPGNLGRNLHKRAGLARALMLQPEILLLDSPLDGLDFRQVSWWLGFLSKLSQGHAVMEGRPTTLVVTTGDLRPWRDCGSHFALLENKRFRSLGGPSHLETHPEPAVRELLAENLSGN